jgi:hypothetical protein
MLCLHMQTFTFVLAGGHQNSKKVSIVPNSTSSGTTSEFSLMSVHEQAVRGIVLYAIYFFLLWFPLALVRTAAPYINYAGGKWEKLSLPDRNSTQPTSTSTLTRLANMSTPKNAPGIGFVDHLRASA